MWWVYKDGWDLIPPALEICIKSLLYDFSTDGSFYTLLEVVVHTLFLRQIKDSKRNYKWLNLTIGFLLAKAH